MWSRAASNFRSLIPPRSIRQMLAIFYKSWILTEFRERKSNSLPRVHDLHKTNANMFSLHFWPLQFYIWLNAVTAVSAFGFKLKEFPWFLPRFSLKVLLPEVFLNIFSAAEGFQMILPVIEDSQSKSRTIFSPSPNRWLRNLELSKSRLRKFWTKQIKLKCGWLSLYVLCLVARY